MQRNVVTPREAARCFRWSHYLQGESRPTLKAELVGTPSYIGPYKLLSSCTCLRGIEKISYSGREISSSCHEL